MNAMTAALWTIYLGFMALSAYATWQVGYFGIFEAALGNGPGGWQVFYDLGVACCVASLYIARDCRERGVSAWPWLITVPLMGSIPLITWVLVRDWVAPRPQP